MDKLSNRLNLFASRHKALDYLRAPRAFRPLRSTGALLCQWRHDPAAGRLYCAWSPVMVECDFDAKPPLRLAA